MGTPAGGGDRRADERNGRPLRFPAGVAEPVPVDAAASARVLTRTLSRTLILTRSAGGLAHVDVGCEHDVAEKLLAGGEVHEQPRRVDSRCVDARQRRHAGGVGTAGEDHGVAGD